mgnify:CR=1 FL=1
MSKMGWIHYLANDNKKSELKEYLHELGWSNKSAHIGATEFIKAANEIKEKNNGMHSVRSQSISKIQPKKKSSRTAFRTVKKDSKNT